MDKTIEMRKHLFSILINQPQVFNTILLGKEINPKTYDFYPNVGPEKQWDKYNWIIKELNIKDKIIRSHGMSSEEASTKKTDGHDGERFFEQFGFDIKKGVKKTDITFEGKSYGSVKSGRKIQWGMHMFNSMNDDIRKIFFKWYLTFIPNPDINERIKCAEDIIEKLNDKHLRYTLINYFLRKNEGIPNLIIRDLKSESIRYYEIKYIDLINVLVDNLTFYHTKGKVKIVGSLKLNKHNVSRNSKKFVIFEFEPRSDKNNAILLHGQSSVIIDIINDYNIKINRIYE